MDALSDVLSMLRVSSALSSRFDGSGAWAFRFPAYQHVKFGGVLEGRCYLWIEGDTEPLALQKGDFYMLTDGQPFCAASVLGRQPFDELAAYRASRGIDGVVRYQGDGSDGHVSLASGRFTFEDDLADLLLRHLPPIIHLRAADLGTSALSSVLDLLKWEVDERHAGADVARSSLAALVLVHVLRAHLASTRQPAGWLGALADAKIGAALSMIHAKPGERWTVGDLASAVGMSRTAFAQQFRRQVGSAPVEYLAQWRMTLARSALKYSAESLTEIAERIGYLSDTAFSIAFKRSSGLSPGRFRANFRELDGSADKRGVVLTHDG
jgi:AraC-like DNA-binding protein